MKPYSFLMPPMQVYSFRIFNVLQTIIVLHNVQNFLKASLDIQLSKPDILFCKYMLFMKHILQYDMNRGRREN